MYTSSEPVPPTPPVPPVPEDELALRRERCRKFLRQSRPDAGGMLVFGRVNTYYLSGVMGACVFWLPPDGAPLFLLRKGAERARLDNPRIATAEYRSFRELPDLAREHGAPFPSVLAAEQSCLPWNLAEALRKRLPSCALVAGDRAIQEARSMKSAWELRKMREAGRRHARCVEELLPGAARPGMSELEIAHALLALFFSAGHCGIDRTNAFGQELVFGIASAGDNGNYPTFYNGPLGCRGMHPAAPFFGCAESMWARGSVLTVDSGFCHEGYNSDKTLCFFAGRGKDIPPRVQKAHDVCREIERAVADRLRPGALPAELYARALDMAEKAGFAEGFMGLGGNKVPFLGHGIGLCIDEWPVLARRFNKPLETCMTFALEPKIGLPGLGMVGTENTWEVTDNEAICLSGGIRDLVCID